MLASILEDNCLNSLSKTEQVAFRLIKSDLLFLYTVFTSVSNTDTSYIVALHPYTGLIIDGCEGWTHKVRTLKENVESFSDEEKQYYTELRQSVKLWETPFSDLIVLLKEKYDKSEAYFSSCCKPIAKRMKLYDIYGAYFINDIFCDNTILDMVFVPRFEYEHKDGDYIRNMAVIAGKIVASFGVTKSEKLETSSSMSFITRDFGGFVKSPVHNSFSEKFVLFSILCSVNFVIHGIDRYIIQEVPIKLRIAYLQYFYLMQQIPQINAHLKTDFSMDSRWIDKEGTFRNCMAHYGIGVVLSQEEVVVGDVFGGLTQKLFYQEWVAMKNSIMKELSQLSRQISSYLGL